MVKTSRDIVALTTIVSRLLKSWRCSREQNVLCMFIFTCRIGRKWGAEGHVTRSLDSSWITFQGLSLKFSQFVQYQPNYSKRVLPLISPEMAFWPNAMYTYIEDSSSLDQTTEVSYRRHDEMKPRSQSKWVRGKHTTVEEEIESKQIKIEVSQETSYRRLLLRRLWRRYTSAKYVHEVSQFALPLSQVIDFMSLQRSYWRAVALWLRRVSPTGSCHLCNETYWQKWPTAWSVDYR